MIRNTLTKQLLHEQAFKISAFVVASFDVLSGIVSAWSDLNGNEITFMIINFLAIFVWHWEHKFKIKQTLITKTWECDWINDPPKKSSAEQEMEQKVSIRNKIHIHSIPVFYFGNIRATHSRNGNRY